MGNMVNMPGSAQPAAARCEPCLSHHRTPSFIHTILWQGCNRRPHPTTLPAPFPVLWAGASLPACSASAQP